MDKGLHYKVRLLNLKFNNYIKTIKEEPRLIKEYRAKAENKDLINLMHSKAEFDDYELAGIKYEKNDTVLITIYYY